MSDIITGDDILGKEKYVKFYTIKNLFHLNSIFILKDLTNVDLFHILVTLSICSFSQIA